MSGSKNTSKENNRSSAVLLSLGTNMEPKLENLTKACQLLNEHGRIIQISSIYESESWGFDANNFYNICVNFRTSLNMIDLLDSCKQIERDLGRDKKVSNEYQSRPIDIDIIFNDQQEINVDQLIIPHYLFKKRSFVLMPAAEISPNFTPPNSTKNLTELLAICEDSGSCIKTNLKIEL